MQNLCYLLEFRDVSNFAKPEELVAFFGLAPSVSQKRILEFCYASFFKKGNN
ncbi:hypothetical protein ACQRBK_04925 [Peptoniphilaceae bacterium SGI.137]